jgi:tetratricopeptide (TPR) repeat protein
MAGWIHNDKNRFVIPRWRDFKQTIELGELNPILGKNLRNKPELNSAFHLNKIYDWNTNKSVKNTIELLNSSIILDDEENSLKAAKFIQSSHIGTKPLKDISERLLYPNENDTSYEQLLDFEQFDVIIGAKIKHLRECLNHNPYNSISWIELARLFLIIGKERPAERCILVATQLAPDNRYISRIGSRFFTHTGDFTKAKQILKANMAFQVDPWLLSADISISSLNNKSSFNIKKGRELIASQNYSSFDLNELLAALATEELGSGNIKTSKRLFNQSLIDPNDNSLAQVVWAKKHITDLDLNQRILEKTPNVFEAKAYQFFNGKSWGPAFSSTIQWFIDQPFSRDPAAFGSFIASSLLEKYDEAIKIAELGLKATPSDFTLLNNLAFAHLKNGDTLNAQQILNKIHIEGLEDQQRVVYMATKGLLFYKQGHIDHGENYYKEASNLAGKIKNKKLQLLVDFHHLSVQLEVQNREEDVSKLNLLVKELEPLDVIYLKDLIKNLFKRLDKAKQPH